MQTDLAHFIRDTPEGREAEAILRKCVHCGFCTATCPTYQVLGDDLDSPRGRIYLIKRALEGAEVTDKTRLHLDRCLTCRACETTCPSGVRYARLADIGRAVVEERTRRSPWDRAKRAVLAWALPRPRIFGAALRAGQALRPVLPAPWKRRIPPSAQAPAWPAPRHARKMLVLAGCVQPALAPGINAAAARVLDRIGISLVEAPGAGCCGALRFHLNYQEHGRDDMRALIDAWWPLIKGGSIEAIVMTASGCGATVKDYVHLLAEDPDYRDKAARISALTRDLAEVIPPAALRPPKRAESRVAFQSPCTLQHGQQIRGKVEALLAASGYELTAVHDAHLCCGSAGTYSLLQPALAGELRGRKLAALQAGMPACIATANIGCLSHLRAGTDVPVRHWVELVDAAGA
jgi:glycolate oxidase iron-sulfur subunit